MSNRLLLACAAAFGVLAGAAALAQDPQVPPDPQQDPRGATESADDRLQATPDAGRTDPTARPDRAHIILTGKVASTGEDQIGLEYQEGAFIPVELDDQDGFNDAQLVDEGDVVTVSGFIDSDLLQARTIEANTLFVHKTGVLFDDYNPYDDEGGLNFRSFTQGYAHPYVLSEGAQVSVSGTVTAVEGREFTLQTSFWTLRVDTDQVAGAWNGDEPFTMPDVGDEVRVSGRFDVGVFERDELAATLLVTLYEPPPSGDVNSDAS